MAKALPHRVVNQSPRFTSQGIPLEDIEREQRELAEKEHFMQRKVKNIVENGFLDNGMYKNIFFLFTYNNINH